MGTEQQAGGSPPSDPIEVVRGVASEAIMRGAAPGDVAQAVLELCAEEPRQPFGDGERDKCRVTTMVEATGVFEQKVERIGPIAVAFDQAGDPITAEELATDEEAKRQQAKPACECGHPYAIHRGVDGGEGCFYSGGADQATACSCLRYSEPEEGT
jgi:hypothetical protein